MILLLYAVNSSLWAHLGVRATSCFDWFLQWIFEFPNMLWSIQTITVAWFLQVESHVWTECENFIRRHSAYILQWFLHISLTPWGGTWCSEGLCRRSQNHCLLQHFDSFSALQVFRRRAQPPCYFRGFAKICGIRSIQHHIDFYDFYCGSVTLVICFGVALTP